MVARGPGDVGCAHCTLIGADRACQVCTRLICERCAADWATCPEPSGRVVRLGLSARVRDVDPTGRLALISHWHHPLRIFDLRRLRWIRGLLLPRRHYLMNRARPPRLLGSQHLVHPEWAWVSHGDSSTLTYMGMRVADLRGPGSHLVNCDMPSHATAVTATGDRFYYVSDTQRVVVIDGATATSYEPLPRKVIQAAHLDAERELLAAASWTELVLHRVVDGTLELSSHSKTAENGDVGFIATGGPWLVAAVTPSGGFTHVEVRRLDHGTSIGAIVHRHKVGQLRGASLSRDGRYLALATDEGLLVHDLDADTTARFTEHTDTINFVRFVGDDHLLVSADTDNRVVMRPRTSDGYARPLVELVIPAEGIELPAERTPAPR